MERGSDRAKEAGRKAAETRRANLSAITKAAAGPELTDAEYQPMVGKGVSYFEDGWRYGILLAVVKGKAVIEHAANAYRKEQVRVSVQDMKPYEVS